MTRCPRVALACIPVMLLALACDPSSESAAPDAGAGGGKADDPASSFCEAGLPTCDHCDDVTPKLQRDFCYVICKDDIRDYYADCTCTNAPVCDFCSVSTGADADGCNAGCEPAPEPTCDHCEGVTPQLQYNLCIGTCEEQMQDFHSECTCADAPVCDLCSRSTGADADGCNAGCEPAPEPTCDHCEGVTPELQHDICIDTCEEDMLDYQLNCL